MVDTAKLALKLKTPEDYWSALGELRNKYLKMDQEGALIAGEKKVRELMDEWGVLTMLGSPTGRHEDPAKDRAFKAIYKGFDHAFYRGTLSEKLIDMYAAIKNLER